MRNRLLVILVLVAPALACAQLTPSVRPPQPVADPEMVLDDRGVMLEVLPAKRAQISVDKSGKPALKEVSVTSAAEPYTSGRMGLVFNHAYQQYGYITGEIAFKSKTGTISEVDFPPALYPNLQQVGTLDMYVVNARSPSEFATVFKRLKSRSDLEWVVPTVKYLPMTSDSPAP